MSDAPTPKKNNLPVIISIVIAAVAAVSTAVYFLFIRQPATQAVASVDQSLFVSQLDHDCFYRIIDVCNQDPYFEGGNSGWDWVINGTMDNIAAYNDGSKTPYFDKSMTSALVAVLDAGVANHVSSATHEAYWDIFTEYKSKASISYLF